MRSTQHKRNTLHKKSTQHKRNTLHKNAIQHKRSTQHKRSNNRATRAPNHRKDSSKPGDGQHSTKHPGKASRHKQKTGNHNRINDINGKISKWLFCIIVFYLVDEIWSITQLPTQPTKQ